MCGVTRQQPGFGSSEMSHRCVSGVILSQHLPSEPSGLCTLSGIEPDPQDRGEGRGAVPPSPHISREAARGWGGNMAGRGR